MISQVFPHMSFEGLPKTCDDMLLTNAIKDSMVNPLDIHSLKSIYTMAGLMKHVYTRYVSDMNIILSAMRPIFNLSPPTGDVKASKNILSIIDTIKMAGLMDRITLNTLNMIESEAVAKERIDDFLRQMIEMVAQKET